MKRRTILSSILVIIACIAVISGSTFALFTSESSVNIAITSGKVRVVATLGTPTLYSADATLTEGTLVDKMNPLDKTGTILPTDSQGVFAGTYYYKQQEGHFLNGGTAAFEDGVLNIKKITPGDKVSTNVKITNESNVDIQYRVKINVLSGLKLYEGLVVKADGLSLKGIQKVGNWTYMAIPTTEEEKTIATIPVDIYLPLDAGNEYQDLSTSIQFTVEAVQGNAKTTNETLNITVNVEEPVAETAATSGQVITDEDQLVEVSVPKEAFTNDITVSNNVNTTTSLSVKIEPQDTISDINLTSTQTAQSYDLEVLIKTQVGEAEPTQAKYNKEGKADATALKIKMFVGTGLTGVKLYHITTPLTSVASLSDVDELNEYYYDSTEGYITLMTNSFSEYTVIYNKDIAIETVNEQTQQSKITVYTPTEDANVYSDPDGKVVQLEVDAEEGYKVDILFDGGDGTESNPYLISSAKQLTNINKEPNGTFFKLNNDIVVASSDYLSVPNSVWENSTLNALISNFNNKTLDGNNHKISLSTNNSYIFSLVQSSTIKNLIVDFNNSSSSIIYAGRNYTFNNVDTTGDLVFNSGNCAAFVVYSYYDATFIDCINKAYIHSTSGDETFYDAIFIGYGMGTGDVTFTNCKNEGTFICGKAGMFMANWSYAANLSFAINDCVNTGVIQSTSPEYYNGVDRYNYCTSDIWDKAGSLKFSFNGGDLLTASTSTKWYDVTAQSSLVGWEGAFVAHSVDSTLALTKKADGTFTITPSSKSEAAYYMVSVGTYTGIKNNGGSSRVYATENNITGTTTTLKALSFVDSDWVTAHPTAIQSTLAGNTIYTLDNVSYYLINRADQLTLGGNVTEPQMISVSVFDETGRLLSAAILGE